jgi:hypothetical protein
LLTIDLQGSDALRCEVGLGAPLPTHTPGSNDPDCLGLILRPVTPLPFLCTLCMFILEEVAAGCSHRHVWLSVQDLLDPLYGFSKLWQAFLLCHPVHRCACLLSLLPLWGQSQSLSMAATAFCKRFCKVADLKLL